MFIALIGYRGSGKTAVAQSVARRLGYDWVDADVEIELQAGKSIAEIFEDDGEQEFRELESQLLNDLLFRDRAVLALGGGVVTRDDSRRLMRAAADAGRGKIVWLKASPEVLYQRIAADAATPSRRPKLTGDGGLEEVRQLLAAREPLYRQSADLEIVTEGKQPEEVAEELAAFIHGKPPRAAR